jgi:ribosome-binding ATPase
MNLSIGIVGLPNAGKSTLFNALLARQIANVAPYPFCTIEPNIGVVEVPDDRVAKLADLYHPKSVVPAVVKFVDIAGLVSGAHKGEGLGNKFLSHVRECNAIAHVLRAFENKDVTREGNIDPKSDFETIKTELCLADLQTLEKQEAPNASIATKEDKKKWEAIRKLRAGLEQGTEASKVDLTDEEKEITNDLFLLTAKEAIFILNISEVDVAKSPDELAKTNGLTDFGEVIPICAKVEMELAALTVEERKAYLEELGLKESGLERLIRRGYEVLGLQTFLTAGEDEVRAWTIKKETKAPQAAGTIHTDFEKGFIKAVVVSYPDLIQAGSMLEAKKKGKVRLEGKEYEMRDGDVVEFMFNK